MVLDVAALLVKTWCASGTEAHMREIFTRTRNGTLRIPRLHSSLFSPTSMRTSLVPIIFAANFLTSLTARGALFLKVMPCKRLCKLMVHSCVHGVRALPFCAMAPTSSNAALNRAQRSRKGSHGVPAEHI